LVFEALAEVGDHVPEEVFFVFISYGESGAEVLYFLPAVFGSYINFPDNFWQEASYMLVEYNC